MSLVAQLAARYSISSDVSLHPSCRIRCAIALISDECVWCSPLQKDRMSARPDCAKDASDSRNLRNAAMSLPASPTASSSPCAVAMCASSTALSTGPRPLFSSAAKSLMSLSRRTTEVRATCERLEGCPSTLRGESPLTAACPLVCSDLCSTKRLRPISSRGAPAKKATLVGSKYEQKAGSKEGITACVTTRLSQVKSSMRGLSQLRPAEKSALSARVSEARRVAGGV
mmetsp:Transcript_11291/g.25232  ORF Transcript_11291/g.25232 Transcript_11291/m.25232 type:complete len:228 (+) Transcript_11291:3974-4657(+)